MAATAPTVTSAVDSHNRPISSHNGRAFFAVTGRRLGPGLQRRLAQPQRGAGAFDIGEFARKLLLLEPRQGRDIFGDPVGGAAARLIGAARCRQHRIVARHVPAAPNRENARTSGIHLFGVNP